MPKLVWFNGKVTPMEDAVVPAADHAHLYGDGIFEGIRIYGGKVFKLDEHLDRLYHGAAYLAFELKLSRAEMKATILDVCRQAGIADGYIRLNLTRGTGLGLDPKAIDRTPNLMIMVSTLALYPLQAYEQGLEVITCSYRVMSPDTLDPRLKCIGRYAANILAKMEANRVGAGEGLMLNAQGYVAECTGDNVFVVKNGAIRTPHRNSGILAGITRQTVLDLAAAEGIPTHEDWITAYELIEADECFLTGTAAEVIPMVKLDGRPIAGGMPGPITQRLMAAFRAHTAHGTPF